MTNAQKERHRFDLWMCKAPRWALREFVKILGEASKKEWPRLKAILLDSEERKS